MTERTDREVERLLQSALERSVPDLCQRAAEEPVTPLLMPDGIVPAPPTRRRRPVRALVLGLCACLVLLLGLGAFSFLRTDAIVVLTVNPGVELHINRYERVLRATPRNDDGAALLEGMNLRYLEVDNAVQLLVGSMALQGYLPDGQDVAVTVEVYGGDMEDCLELQEDLAEEIEEMVARTGARAFVNLPLPAHTMPPATTPAPSPTPVPVVAVPPATTPDGVTSATLESQPTPDAVTAATPETRPPADTAGGSPADPVAQRALANGIRYGKQVLIERICALDPGQNTTELAAMPTGKLASLVQRLGLDLNALFPDYDPDDSVKENLEDYIDDLDDDYYDD